MQWTFAVYFYISRYLLIPFHKYLSQQTENPRLLCNNAKIIWFEFCIILHECPYSSVLLQREWIGCTEAISVFFSCLLIKNIFSFKCRP